jgi:predicted nucleic acid-binding protein
MPGSAEVAEATWIRRQAIVNRTLLDSFPTTLHEGEREAIALAKEQTAQLLIDEIRARKVAIDLGIEVIETLRILAEAKRLAHIESVRSILLQMQSSGYRFERELIQAFLERIGEA